MEIAWVTVFVDRPADGFDRTREFWRQVTGTTMSSTRGADDEFATFVPADGEAVLKIQRTGDGSSSSHLDLHVADPAALATRAEQLGATRIDEFGDVVVLHSPGGLAWCAVPVRVEGGRPSPAGSGGERTLLDQVSIDVAPDRFDAECEFWSALTGWAAHPGVEPEYVRLDVPAAQPLRFLLQRRGDAAAGERTDSHLDLACDDVERAVAAHVELGARVVERFRWWTVMADPAGVPYCLTARDPDTGRPG